MPAGRARTLALLVAVLQPASGLDNGAATRPPMGWLSWERWRCFVDCDLDPANCLGERLVLETAARMVQVRVTRTSLVAPYGLYITCYKRISRFVMAQDGYLAAGYSYLDIDDCWCNVSALPTPAAGEYGGCRDAAGRLQPDAKRFPHGMKYIADKLHGMVSALQRRRPESKRLPKSERLRHCAGLRARDCAYLTSHHDCCWSLSQGLKFGLYTSVGDCTSNHLPSIYNFTADAVVQADVDQMASWGIDALKVSQGPCWYLLTTLSPISAQFRS